MILHCHAIRLFALLATVGACASVDARTWTDKTGKFRVEAELIGVKEGAVRLKKTGGGEITVPLEKLSEADRAFVERDTPQPSPPAALPKGEGRGKQPSPPAPKGEGRTSQPSPATAPAAEKCRVAVIGRGGDVAKDLSALVEMRLGEMPGVALVERAEIDKIVKEQELQATFAPEGVGRRCELGRMLKADLLVWLDAQTKPVPHIRLVVSETRQGLRLCVEPVFLTNRAETDAAAMFEKFKDAAKKRQEKFTDIVAVPPLLNNSLTQEADNMQGGFACFVEQALLRRPGLLVVELAEAKALAQEMAIGGDAKIERRLPLYLLGEYRVEGSGEKRLGQFAWRLLRGERELGRRERKEIPWPKISEPLRQTALELIDKAAGKSVPPSDPLAEAKHLADREKVFLKIGQWHQALALAEAGLLLNPEQPAVHRDALRAMLEINKEGNLLRHDSEKAFRLLREALPHFEAFACGTELTADDRYYADKDHWGYDMWYVSEVREGYYALLGEMRDTANRILDRKAKAKVWDCSISYFVEWTDKSRNWAYGRQGCDPWTKDESLKARLYMEWLKKDLKSICENRLKLLKDFSWRGGQQDFVWGLQRQHGYDPSYYGLLNVPGVRGFSGSGSFFDQPSYHLKAFSDPEMYSIYLDFFKKVKNMPDPHLQEVIAPFVDRISNLPKFLAEEGKKQEDKRKSFAQVLAKQKPKPVPVKDPEALFHPIELRQTTADGGEMKLQWNQNEGSASIEKWIPLYEGCDLICLEYDKITLMKEKGRLRTLPIKIAMSRAITKDNISRNSMGELAFSNVCWDGQYIWALNPGKDGPLAVIEPRSEKIWRTGQKFELPPSESCAIAPLGDGRVCIAGYFGRLWIALASFDPVKGFQTKVIFEARDVLDWEHMGMVFQMGQIDPKVTSPRLALPVLFADTLFAPAADGRPAQQRVMIGRKANSPLVVDPKTQTVTAETYHMLGGTFFDGKSAYYFMTVNTQRNSEGYQSGAFFRIALPEMKREMLCPDRLAGPLAFHKGQYHLITPHSIKFEGGVELPSRYCIGPSPTGPFRTVRCNCPDGQGKLYLSNHYGLLLATSPDVNVYQVEMKPKTH